MDLAHYIRNAEFFPYIELHRIFRISEAILYVETCESGFIWHFTSEFVYLSSKDGGLLFGFIISLTDSVLRAYNVIYSFTKSRYASN